MRNVALRNATTRLGFAAALVIVAAGASACSSTTAKAEPCPAADQINVEVKALDKYKFEPAVMEAKAGKFVIKLVEAGSLPHNIRIRGLDGTAAVSSSSKSACATFTLAKGTYTYYCSVSGHEAAGMIGTLTVS